MKHAALATAVAEVGDAAAAAVIAAFYEDPWWEARFGPRGRRYADEDCRHHVAHLVQALRADDKGLFAAYARWLQSLLCTRGMCSRHIAMNFRRLGAALQQRLPGVDVAAAVAVLDAGTAALRADAGAVSLLEAAIDDGLAGRVARAVGGGWPDEEDAGLLLSHLGDSVRLGRPELFAEHWRWMIAFHNLGAARADVVMAAVAGAIGDHDLARRTLESA